MAAETAIIIPVPEAESAVGQLRARYDRAAGLGAPPHITLLYPFLAPEAAAGQAAALGELFAAIPAFAFQLSSVGRFTRTAYLRPDRQERFIQITEALLARWPECRPYGGAFAEIVPHLTVADDPDLEVLDAVEQELKEGLPILCTAREAWLFTSSDSGQWAKAGAFPLAAAR